ncbi:hypothetical protein [Ruminococcus sp.]|uniref:hypothetical protein n=1 Tax=Ruminococcus sp. TaxID=41978 RepID=UPI003991FF99
MLSLLKACRIIGKGGRKDIRRELSSANSAYKEIVSRVNDEIYRQRQAKSKEMER